MTIEIIELINGFISRNKYLSDNKLKIYTNHAIKFIVSVAFVDKNRVATAWQYLTLCQAVKLEKINSQSVNC